MGNQGNEEPLDYHTYHLSLKEMLAGAAGGLAVTWGTAWIVYRSLCAAIFMTPLALAIVWWLRQNKRRRRLERLRREFKEGMTAVYNSLSAGSTLECAFVKASGDVKLCCGAESYIYREFCLLCKRMDLNWTVEQCIEDFSRRSGDEDIQNFSDIISIAKRSGGSLPQIVKNGIDNTRMKMEVEQEIETMVSGKKKEFYFMAVIPAGIILYMRVFSSGFLDILYDSMAGNIIMTVCLIIYIAALFWGSRITNIKV